MKILREEGRNQIHSMASSRQSKACGHAQPAAPLQSLFTPSERLLRAASPQPPSSRRYSSV